MNIPSDNLNVSYDELKVEDNNNRKKIANEIGVNIMVEAGAGSGKTKSMVDRLISIINSGSPMNSIVAITFTKKASSELRERLFKEIKEKAKEPIFAQALREIDECYVGTVHAFCSRLLKTRPVEAKVDVNFTELDALNDKLHSLIAWEKFIKNSKENEDINYLLGQGISLEDIHAAYDQIRTHGDLDDYAGIDIKYTVKPDVYNLLYSGNQSIIKYINGFVSKHINKEFKGSDNFEGILIMARDVFSNRNNSPKAYVNVIQKLIKSYESEEKFQKNITLKNYVLTPDIAIEGVNIKDTKPNDVIRKLAFKAYNDIKELIGDFVNRWEEYIHHTMLKIAIDATKYYQQYRMERSLLSFQDLLVLTRDVLKNSREVRSYYQRKIKHLLIDEFQDTDPLQSEIMFYLASDVEYKEKCNSWTQLTLRPGALFVVGDPKQSIYRFRKADIRIYNKVKELIVKKDTSEQEGLLLHLYQNFRTDFSVVDWVNRKFNDSALMGMESSNYQADYTDAITDKHNVGDSISGVRVITNHQEEEHIIKIADIVIDAVESGKEITKSRYDKEKGVVEYYTEKVTYKDFMLLCMKKKVIDKYRDEFIRRGIPVKVTGSKKLFNIDVMMELLCLLKAANNYNDRLALVGALRGIFFGISDAEILQYEQQKILEKEAKNQRGLLKQEVAATSETTINRQESLKEKKDHDIIVNPKTEQEFAYNKVLKAIKKNDEYRTNIKQLPPLVAFEKIIEDIGVFTYIKTTPNADSEINIVYQVLEYLRNAESDLGGRFDMIINKFQSLIELSSEDSEAVTDELDIMFKEEAVRIMNVHQSKGLEAPIVILLEDRYSESGSPLPIKYHIERLEVDNEYKSIGYFTFYSNKSLLAKPNKWEEKESEEKKHDDAENNRKIYVAATRAANLLIIAKARKQLKSGIEDVKKATWKKLHDKNVGNLEIEEYIIESPESPDNKVPKNNNENRNISQGDCIFNEICFKEQKEFSYTCTSPTSDLFKNQFPIDINSYSKKEEVAAKEVELKEAIVAQEDVIGGINYGSAFHIALEELIITEDVEQSIQTALQAYDLSDAEEKRLNKEINELISDKNDLWQLIQSNKGRVMTEVPFNIMINANRADYGEFVIEHQVENGLIVQGAIDMVVKNANDEWVIIDFKTDQDIGDESAKIPAKYRRQLAFYVMAWEQTINEKVTAGYFYSSITGKLV